MGPRVRAARNYQLKSVLAKGCREGIKEELKVGREEVLTEAAEKTSATTTKGYGFTNSKIKTMALGWQDGTISSSRTVMEKATYASYSKLSDSQVHLLSCHHREDVYVVSVIPFQV